VLGFISLLQYQLSIEIQRKMSMD
jgi:hypothetical protein